MSPLFLAPLLLLARVHGMPQPEDGECCTEKMVGGVSYTLLGTDDSGMFMELSCLSNCVFEKDGLPGSKFCFGRGDMSVECQGDMMVTPPAVPEGETGRPGDLTGGPGGETEGPGGESPPPPPVTEVPGGGVVCPQVLCCGSDGVTYPTPCDLPEGVTCVSNNECTATTTITPAAEPCGDPSCGLTCPSGSKCVSTGAVCVTSPCCPANGCTGPMEPKEIPWSYGMTPADVCVTPGTNVTFQWSSGHNVVSGLTSGDFSSCSGLTDTSATAGPWTWMAPTTSDTYYFACGVGDGFHCNNGGMKAAVNVQDACPGV